MTQPQLARRFGRLWRKCAGDTWYNNEGVIKCEEEGETLTYFTFIFSLTSAKKRRLL
jgi:hypothetical protein